MVDYKNLIFRAAFEALYFSGLTAILRPVLGGVGAILTLHHVRPARQEEFQPNRFLEITPEFLGRVIERLQRQQIDLVSIDEAHRRLTEGDFKRPFVAITLDDGYRDNKTCALPVFKKYSVPFTVFIATSFPDRRGQLWWVALERIVAANASVIVAMEGSERRLECQTAAQKNAVYVELRAYLASRSSETEMLAVMRDLMTRYSIAMASICDELCMTWQEIADLAADPLATIGAHTVNHIMLGRSGEDEVRSELQNSRATLEAKLGRAVRHFAYPYGDARTVGKREYAIAAELGYKTAVTTLPSVLRPEHVTHLTALPRVTLSGEFQRERYVDVLVSGAATALWGGLRRVKPS